MTGMILVPPAILPGCGRRAAWTQAGLARQYSGCPGGRADSESKLELEKQWLLRHFAALQDAATGSNSVSSESRRDDGHITSPEPYFEALGPGLSAGTDTSDPPS